MKVTSWFRTWRTCRGGLSHGEVRPSYQESTYPTKSTLGPHMVQIWSRNALEHRGKGTRTLHRVEGLSEKQVAMSLPKYCTR